MGTMPPPKLLQGIPLASPAGTGSNALCTESVLLTIEATLALATSVAVAAASATPPPASQTHAPDSSSVVCNLLPSMGQSADSTGQADIYVGEGLLPVPAKLGERIARWEFIEMAELLPEFWSPLNPSEASSTPTIVQGRPRRKRTVTDIATWLQCFAT